MAVGDAYVFPGFLTPVLTKLSFQSHRLLFLHALAEVRGENTLEKKFACTEYRTRNHHFKSPTRSPLSHPGRQSLDLLNLESSADDKRNIVKMMVFIFEALKNIVGKKVTGY